MNVYDMIRLMGDEGMFVPKPASEVCRFVPGTFEKIETMRRRVMAGEELWHPDDVVTFDDVVGGPRRNDSGQVTIGTMGNVRIYNMSKVMGRGERRW